MTGHRRGSSCRELPLTVCMCPELAGHETGLEDRGGQPHLDGIPTQGFRNPVRARRRNGTPPAAELRSRLSGSCELVANKRAGRRNWLVSSPWPRRVSENPIEGACLYRTRCIAP